MSACPLSAALRGMTDAELRLQLEALPVEHLRRLVAEASGVLADRAAAHEQQELTAQVEARRQQNKRAGGAQFRADRAFDD